MCLSDKPWSMSEVMVDRLHSDIIQTALAITAGNNSLGISPSAAASNVRDLSQLNDARLLPMFPSYVASARGQSGSYTVNSSNEDILAAINKLNVQHPFFITRDPLAQMKLLNNAITTASSHDTNSPLTTGKHTAPIVNSSETNKRISNGGAKLLDQMTATMSAKKRLSSLSSSNHSSNKKIRFNESNAKVCNVATLSIQLSDSERRESFPLPSKRGSRKRQETVQISKLPILSKMWDDFEMISYNMDDTVADQQAFVKRLFTQSLHRSKMCHLKDRIHLPSATICVSKSENLESKL
jgi:hypothetical protein